MSIAADAKLLLRVSRVAIEIQLKHCICEGISIDQAECSIFHASLEASNVQQRMLIFINLFTQLQIIPPRAHRLQTKFTAWRRCLQISLIILIRISSVHA